MNGDWVYCAACQADHPSDYVCHLKWTTTANALQIGGNHYKSKVIQTWDYIHANDIGFLAGNVIKYVSRYKQKGGVEDLKKAAHYLQKLIEEETS